MTKRQFVILAFRLFALYLVFNLLSNLSSILNPAFIPRGGITNFLIAGFAIFIALTFISLLWRKSEWLMQKVFAIPVLSDVVPQEDHEVTQREPREVAEGFTEGHIEEASGMMDYYETPISEEGIQLVAFSVVGLWAIFNILPSLVREIDMVAMDMFRTKEEVFKFLLPQLLQFALGVWLFLRPWQFQGWIKKFKPQHDRDEHVVKSN
jgi:hypothetical protein